MSASPRGKHELADQFIKEVIAKADYFAKPESFPSGQTILNLDPAQQAEVATALLVGIKKTPKSQNDWMLKTTGRALLIQLFKRRLPFSQEDLAFLLRTVIACPDGEDGYFDIIHLPCNSILGYIERWVAQNSLTPCLRTALIEFQAHPLRQRSAHRHKDLMNLHDRAQRILDGTNGVKDIPDIVFVRGEPWSDWLEANYRDMSSQDVASWNPLLHHAQTATSAKPSQKWLKVAAALMQRVTTESFNHVVRGCLLQMPAVKTLLHDRNALIGRTAANPLGRDPRCFESAQNLLRGLIWLCSVSPDTEVIRAIGDAAEFCFKKIPNIGAPYPKIGNACLFTLGAISNLDAVTQLGRLKLKVKYPVALKLLEKSLDRAADTLGQSKEVLEEIATPTFGLSAGGVLEQRLGDATARLRIVDTHRTELSWRTSDGKTPASVPSQVKQGHATELKELKKTAKEIEKTLPAQRARIERLMLIGRSWELKTWRERYLDQPLLSFLARRLIWQFDLGDRSTLGIWREEGIVGADNTPLKLSDEHHVRLWHPLNSTPETVLAWRRFLEDRQITQPFKQAHREIYLLTDAERHTNTYSNRFAAHILRQHQFAALCRERGWRYHLMGAFDSHNTPTLQLPDENISVQYYVDSPENNEQLGETGIYLYIITDQVRFCGADGEPRPLAELPPLLFSEVMRDVDLFVGVCSVGNDPMWRDRGQQLGNGNYWQDYSFGELSATAQTRKELLIRLLPKLKIAPQCALDGKFLLVKGTLRDYKIHLGSGNILMSPNDQYLCIVPDRSRKTSDSGNVFLPFEGDQTLAIILSKAMLLINDNKIKDESILRQIKQG